MKPDAFEGSHPEVNPSIIPTEDALAELNDIPNENETPEGAHLHALTLIHRTEESNEFDEHENGDSLTIERVSNSAKNMTALLRSMFEEAKDEERGEIEKKIKFVSHRADEIMHAATSYAKSVYAFKFLKDRQSHFEPEDFQDKFQSADNTRRRRHDHLIQTLKTYTGLIREIFEQYSFDPSVLKEWDPVNLHSQNVAFSTVYDDTKIYLFGSKFLTDRQAIQTWAIAEVFRRRLKEIDLHSAKLAK